MHSELYVIWSLKQFVEMDDRSALHCSCSHTSNDSYTAEFHTALIITKVEPNKEYCYASSKHKV